METEEKVSKWLLKKNISFTSSVKSSMSNRCFNEPAVLSASSSVPSMSVNVDPSWLFVLLLFEAARLAASKIAVRAKFDLLLVVSVDDDVDDGGGTGVAGADDGEIDEVGIIVDSLGTSLSDKLFLLRVKLACEVEEGSVKDSAIGSESDRERDCWSVLMVNGFRVDEKSSIAVESVCTTGESVGDEDR